MKDPEHVEHLSAGFPDELLAEDPILPIFTSLTGGTQGVLFDDERQALDDTVGYRGATLELGQALAIEPQDNPSARINEQRRRADDDNDDTSSDTSPSN